MQARVGALGVVGVLAHPARRVVPGVVGQGEAVRARVQQQLARRRIRVVGDVEHGAGADVDVAVDEHASKHPPAGRLRQTSICTGGHEEFRSHPPPGRVRNARCQARTVGVRPHVGVRPARCGSDPGCAAVGAREAQQVGDRCSLGCARCEPGGEEDRSAGRGVRSGVGAGLGERVVHADARQARCGQGRGEARRGRAEEGGVRAGPRCHRRCALEQLALARIGVQRAAAQVVVTARDQDDGARRVQLEAGRRLGRRRRERVADDLAAVDVPEVLAPQRQPAPFGECARDGIRGARRRAARRRLRGGLPPGRGAAAARGSGRSPRPRRRYARSGDPTRFRRPDRRPDREGCSGGSAPATSAPSSLAPGSSALTTVQSSAAWNATIRRLAATYAARLPCWSTWSAQTFVMHAICGLAEQTAR